MQFALKSYKELISMTKEKLDEAMVPLRVRAAKAKADSEIIKLEERMLELEARINEACVRKDIDFTDVANKLDEYDLLARRLQQITELVAKLFTADSDEAAVEK